MWKISIILCLLLSGCCHYSPMTKTIWGIGKVKLNEKGDIVEMECNSPIDLYKM